MATGGMVSTTRYRDHGRTKKYRPVYTWIYNNNFATRNGYLYIQGYTTTTSRGEIDTYIYKDIQQQPRAPTNDNDENVVRLTEGRTLYFVDSVILRVIAHCHYTKHSQGTLRGQGLAPARRYWSCAYNNEPYMY